MRHKGGESPLQQIVQTLSISILFSQIFLFLGQSGRLSLQGLCEHRLQQYSKSRRLAEDLAKCNLSERAFRGVVPKSYRQNAPLWNQSPQSVKPTHKSRAHSPLKIIFQKSFCGARLACKSIFEKATHSPSHLSSLLIFLQLGGTI